MMNVIAIGLVMASMAFAGVWSPNAANLHGVGEQVIVKGGHRSVVVEYDDDSGHVNTKVSISPPLTDTVGPDGGGVARGAGEYICDALGKCKHKITGAIYNAKNKVTDTAEEVEEGTKESVGSLIGKTKEAATKATRTAKHGADMAKDGASRAKEVAEEGASRAKEAAEEAADELKQKGIAAVGNAAEKGKSAVGNAAEKAKNTRKEMSDIGKRGKEVVQDAASWLIPRGIFTSLMGVIHMLGFATAYGTGAWVTFAMSHLLSRSLPRQQFGVVQSRVYPIYFKVMGVSIGAALLGHLFGHRQSGVSSLARTLQAYNLAGLVATVLANLCYLEPRATKVMYERMKIEKEEGRGVHQTARFVEGGEDTLLATATTTTTTATTRKRDDGEARTRMERLTTKLRKLNSYSSLLNVITLMGLTLHLVYLSQRLCL